MDSEKRTVGCGFLDSSVIKRYFSDNDEYCKSHQSFWPVIGFLDANVTLCAIYPEKLAKKAKMNLKKIRKLTVV